MFAGHPVPLTVSFGVVTFPVHVADSDELQSAAENALYAAKVLGRDRSVLHSDEVAEILTAGGDGSHTRDEAQLATVLNLAEALDMRDEGTARHSQTVGRYCEMMARELGFDREHADRVRVAGVLHDIGKIGVADSILQKPGPLTDAEYDAMKKHPEIGARILGGSGLADIRQWVLAHHERPDGRGYPARHNGRTDPVGGAHPGRGRRLRGHDQRPRLPQGHRPRGRARRSCSSGRATSSTPRWSTHSCARSRPTARHAPPSAPERGRQRACSVGLISSSFTATRRGRVTM